jgi:hypothetical protein
MNFLEHSKQAMDIFRKFLKKAMKILQKPAIYRCPSAMGSRKPRFWRFRAVQDPQ